MIYVDTSVVLAHLLSETRRPADTLWADDIVSSRLQSATFSKTSRSLVAEVCNATACVITAERFVRFFDGSPGYS